MNQIHFHLFWRRRIFVALYLGMVVLTFPFSSRAEIPEAPQVYSNPNPSVPNVAILRFSGHGPFSAHVKVEGGGHGGEVDFSEGSGGEGELPILGMWPDSHYRFSVRVTDQAGREQRYDGLQFHTPPLPADFGGFPPIEITVSEPEKMEPGVTFLSIRRRHLGRPGWHEPYQMDWFLNWSTIVAVDERGRVVWYYISDRRISGIERLANGNLFYHTAGYWSFEIDMLGNIVQSWYAGNRPQGSPDDPAAIPVPVDTLHHQPHETSRGTFLAMAASAREVPDWYTDEYDVDAPRQTQMVMGDSIVEFDRSGRIIWEWDAFDHLDLQRIGYNTIDPYWHVRSYPNHMDWTHGNGVTQDHRDKSVIMSFRNQDAVIKVDYETKKIRWILGTHEGWPEHLQGKLLKPVGETFQWPWHGHNPRVTSQGTIVMYDNSIHRARPFDGRPQAKPHETLSRGVEYAIDEKSMTVRQLWASAEHGVTEDRCNSWAMGDTHRLPLSGNMLVVDSVCVSERDDLTFDAFQVGPHVADLPYRGRVREYRRSLEGSEVIFELFIADKYGRISWETYGALRSPSLYPDKLESK